MNKTQKIFKANKENNKIIENYLDYYKTKKPHYSKATIRSIKTALEKLSHFLEHKTKHKKLKPAPSEELMLKFFNNRYYVPLGSYNLFGNNIIPFFRWVEKIGKHTRPKNMDWFETTSKQSKRKLDDPHRKDKLLIFPDEYEKIINYSDDFYGQNKAIWQTYYISGFRPEELQSMTIGDVKETIDKNNNATVFVSCPKSKRWPREIPLPEYPDCLMRYIGNHPLNNDKNAPLWFVLKGSVKLKQLTMKAIRGRFEHMRKDLNLKLTLNIKSFRKTRATLFFSSEDPLINNDTTIGRYMGWETKTVADRRKEYNLYNTEDLRKAICKKPMLSTSFDTIKSNLDTYKPKIEKLEKTNMQLKKELSDTKKILDTNRQEYLDTKQEFENRFKKIAQNLKINLNPKTPSTQNTLSYFKPVLINFVEKITGKKLTKEQLEEIDKGTNLVLNELKELPVDEISNLVKPENLPYLYDQIKKKKQTK